MNEKDRGLFQHERERFFEPLQTLTGSWDFTREGLLLKPKTGKVDSRSFQAERPGGLASLKLFLKGIFYRWTQPRKKIQPLPGRQFLIITDEFSNGYFHWVTDALPKLAWLMEELDRFELLLPAFTHRFSYMTESLAAWPQLRWRVVEASCRTAVTDALLVPALAPTGNYRPETLRTLGKTWRTKLGVGKPFRKVYVSRAKAPWRKIRNEAEVEALTRSLDFETVFLEELSFEAQARLLAETQILVSNHGAGLTNMLFQQPGSRVLEIRLRDDAHNNCYFSLASAVELEYAYLLADPAEPKTKSVHTADLLVDVEELASLLKKWS
ncbi:MAG: glycosyltransferase family 61 protein [Spirochaetales bacterium]|nr:glycosyltransferase family 61 protein [Spirochaetales bacterium]